MSFFDNTKNFGTAMLIVGLISALVGIIGIVMEATGDCVLGTMIATIGAVIYGLMIAGMGLRVRNGEITKRIELLGQFILIVGAGYFVVSLFGGIGAALGAYGNESTLVGGIGVIIIGLIIALIVTFAGKKVLDNRATAIDKVIWILLLVIFVILILVNLVGIFSVLADVTVVGGLSSVASFCNVIVYVFLLLTLTSEDVKKEMGI